MDGYLFPIKPSIFKFVCVYMCVCVQEPSLVSVFKLCCFCAYVLLCSVFILTFMWTFTHTSTHTHTQSEIQAHTHTEIQTRTPNMSHRPPLGKCVRQGNKPSLTSHHHSYSSHEHTMWSNKEGADRLCESSLAQSGTRTEKKSSDLETSARHYPTYPLFSHPTPYWTTICTKFSFLHIS